MGSISAHNNVIPWRALICSVHASVNTQATSRRNHHDGVAVCPSTRRVNTRGNNGTIFRGFERCFNASSATRSHWRDCAGGGWHLGATADWRNVRLTALAVSLRTHHRPTLCLRFCMRCVMRSHCSFNGPEWVAKIDQDIAPPASVGAAATACFPVEHTIRQRGRV
jgi:hypothetical protein